MADGQALCHVGLSSLLTSDLGRPAERGFLKLFLAFLEGGWVDHTIPFSLG